MEDVKGINDGNRSLNNDDLSYVNKMKKGNVAQDAGPINQNLYEKELNHIDDVRPEAIATGAGTYEMSYPGVSPYSDDKIYNDPSGAKINRNEIDIDLNKKEMDRLRAAEDHKAEVDRKKAEKEYLKNARDELIAANQGFNIDDSHSKKM